MRAWLISLAFLVWLEGAEATTLKGKVTDVTGAAVQHAYVFVFDDQARISPETTFPGKSVITERSGVFQIEVGPGFYDVCVFSSGFTTACRKIQVAKGQTSFVHNVEVKVDPLILKERGDRFSPQ